MLLHGNSKPVEEDVGEVGKVIEIKFSGDCSNQFSVLSRRSVQGDLVGVLKADGTDGEVGLEDK